MTTRVSPTAAPTAASSLPPISMEELSAALYRGDLAKVQAYIKSGGDVNAKDKELTPLMQLAQRSHNDPQVRQNWLEIAEYLVSRGADVTSKDKWGATALHHAAFWGADWLVPLLLKKGASVDQQDDKGNTPLFFACEGNWSDPWRNRVAELLVETKKIDLNLELALEKGPFAYLAQAAIHKNWELMKILLREGADPNLLTSPNIDPKSSVHIAGQVSAAWFALDQGREYHFALILLSAHGATFKKGEFIKRTYSLGADASDEDDFILSDEKDLTGGQPIEQLVAQAALEKIEELERYIQFTERTGTDSEKRSVLPDQKA